MTFIFLLCNFNHSRKHRNLFCLYLHLNLSYNDVITIQQNLLKSFIVSTEKLYVSDKKNRSPDLNQ